LHHLHVRHLRRSRFRQLHQLLSGSLLPVVCCIVFPVRGGHLLWSWFCSVHHLHRWYLCYYCLSDLFTLCGRYLLCKWLWHLRELYWWNSFRRRFRVLCDLQCGKVRCPGLRYLPELRRR